MESIAKANTMRKKTIQRRFNDLPNWILKSIKVLSPVVGLFIPILLFIPFLLTLIFTLARYAILGKSVYYLNKSRTAISDIYGGKAKQKRFSLELGWNPFTPKWGITFDGEGEKGPTIMITYWILGLTFYLQAVNLFPGKWFPVYYTSDGQKTNWGCREYRFALHNRSSWLSLHNDHSGWLRDPGLMISFDPVQLITGYGKVTYNFFEFREFFLPMIEGTYPVVTVRKEQVRKYRWWKKVTPSFEVIAGQIEPWPGEPLEYGSTFFVEDEKGKYYPNLDKWLTTMYVDNWREYKGPRPEYYIKGLPIPIPGKGENSWDCEDTATYSLSTGSAKSHQEAALKLMDYIMRTRWRHGGSKWCPQQFEGVTDNFIKP